MAYDMKESTIQNKIRLAVSKFTKCTLFRNNVGTGWIGRTKRTTNGNDIFIENARPLRAGLCVGSSDLIGWTIREITPDMVGKKIAIFTAVEIKKPSGRTSKDQLNFIQQVRTAGGIAGIAKDESDAVNLLNEFKI